MSTPSATRLPRIALVGRPNVGKSTLTNRLCGSRVSIVEPTAGVTRDRVAIPVEIRDGERTCWAEVIDTGGIGIVDRDDLGPQVEAQVLSALQSAEMVLFLVDAREGVTPLDLEVAKRLRGFPVPVLLVANKCETKAAEFEAEQFRTLGFRDGPWPISAQNGNGLSALCARVIDLLPAEAEGETTGPPPPAMRLAVVGQRNAGKSSLINRLAREERMIVSERPGTTRDSVDVWFEREGLTFVAIDTAGVRKKRSIADAIEFYSDSRSRRSIRRADVVVLLFDVTRELSGIDKDLARYAIEHHKPLILGANKWDLVDGLTPGDFKKYIEAQLPSATFAPVSFLSALDGSGVDETLELAQELFAQSRKRVGTGELNRVLQRALEARNPSRGGQSARMYYATQADTTPPTFVIFVNEKKHFNKDYLRYLQGRLREELGFPEIPVRIALRMRGAEQAEGRDASRPKRGPGRPSSGGAPADPDVEDDPEEDPE
ncbi:MAG: ribosome biogenesis GTPase Der [Planctomycetes bacterium]|nr:ribosome biogenesis GTPase Der [Planctomycetota bacterium]